MTEVVIVAAAVLVRRSRLLVAQRAYPPLLAGLWELPGGKVRPGEDEPSALARECLEELHIDVRPIRRVGDELPIAAPRMWLRVWQVESEGIPVAAEHQQLAWVTADDLAGLAWLPADRTLVPTLGDLLSRGP